MINFKLPLLAMAVGSVCLLWGCQSAPKSERSTGAQAPATTGAPAAKSADAKEGEIIGTPAKNSKFTKLQMGMGMKQVTDLIGSPTDQGAYVTGKAFIPFYFGGDRYRHELVRVCQRSFKSADRQIHTSPRRMRGFRVGARHRARSVRWADAGKGDGVDNDGNSSRPRFLAASGRGA